MFEFLHNLCPSVDCPELPSCCLCQPETRKNPCIVISAVTIVACVFILTAALAAPHISPVYKSSLRAEKNTALPVITPQSQESLVPRNRPLTRPDSWGSLTSCDSQIARGRGCQSSRVHTPEPDTPLDYSAVWRPPRTNHLEWTFSSDANPTNLGPYTSSNGTAMPPPQNTPAQQGTRTWKEVPKRMRQMNRTWPS